MESSYAYRSILEMLEKGSLHCLASEDFYDVARDQIPEKTPTIDQLLKAQDCQSVPRERQVALSGSRGYMASLANRVERRVPCRVTRDFLAAWTDSENLVHVLECPTIQYCGVAYSEDEKVSLQNSKDLYLLVEILILRDINDQPMICAINGVHRERPLCTRRFNPKNFPTYYTRITEAYQRFIAAG